MELFNSTLKKTFAFDSHAIQRFMQRADGDIGTRFKSALPFAGQLGDCQFLIDKDIVFVCSRERVITCLTRQQALGNIEGIQHINIDLNALLPEIKKAEIKPLLADEIDEEMESLLDQFFNVATMSVEEIVDLSNQISQLRKKYRIVPKVKRKEFNRHVSVLEYICKLLNKVDAQKEKAERVQKEYVLFRNEVRKLITIGQFDSIQRDVIVAMSEKQET